MGYPAKLKTATRRDTQLELLEEMSNSAFLLIKNIEHAKSIILDGNGKANINQEMHDLVRVIGCYDKFVGNTP